MLEQLLVGGTAPKASQPEEESREDLEADGSQSTGTLLVTCHIFSLI